MEDCGVERSNCFLKKVLVISLDLGKLAIMGLFSKSLDQKCVVSVKCFQTLRLGAKGAVLIGSQVPAKLLFFIANTVVFFNDAAGQMFK